jgi:Asp-tRNA(Asn)/Glu-tRNA(Gln) amidotransferase A subunit family amidase
MFIDQVFRAPFRHVRSRMMSADLAYAGLARQAQLVREGDVTARELVELSLERIERLDPKLNAFAAVYAEQARRQAEDPRPGRLSGVPIAVKDEMDIGGEITSHGTGAIMERAPEDSEVVRRLKDAGDDEGGGHWVCFGGLTRSVADSKLLLDVLAPGIALPEPRRLRIAYSEKFPPGTRGKLTPEMRQGLRDTKRLLAELGHEVVERDPDFRARDLPIVLAIMFRGIRDIVSEIEHPQRLERRSRHLARPGRLVSDRTVDRLLVAERRIAERVGRLWDEVDVLLMPILAAPAVPAQLMEGRGATVTYLWESGWVPFGVLWNSTGQPAASVPAGFAPDGLPLAVQLVGRPHDEGTLLSLSQEIEDARPWGLHRPAAFAW